MAEEQHSQVRDRDIGVEMRESFMSYAMSIIVSRALPRCKRRIKTGASSHFVCDV